MEQKKIYDDEEEKKEKKLKNINEKIQLHYSKLSHIVFSEKVPKLFLDQYLTKSMEGLVDLENYKCAKLAKKDEFKKKTILLDIDETLVHLSNAKVEGLEFFTFKRRNSNGEAIDYFINLRPYCIYFLEEISKDFEVYIFSAGSLNYVEMITRFLDPKCELIDGIVNQSNCFITHTGKKIKDLRVIKGRKQEDMILIDNLTINFGEWIENCIPVLDFIDNTEDKELCYLVDFLKIISNSNDVRTVIKEKFNLRQIVHSIIDDII